MLFFTFEQEIVFIVSVPHSSRGRSSTSCRKGISEVCVCELSLHTIKRLEIGTKTLRQCWLSKQAGRRKGKLLNSAEGEEPLQVQYLPLGVARTLQVQYLPLGVARTLQVQYLPLGVASDAFRERHSAEPPVIEQQSITDS